MSSSIQLAIFPRDDTRVIIRTYSDQEPLPLIRFGDDDVQLQFRDLVEARTWLVETLAKFDEAVAQLPPAVS